MTNREKALAYLGAAYAQLLEAVEYFNAAEDIGDTSVQEYGIEAIELAEKNLDCANHAVWRLKAREKQNLRRYKEEENAKAAEAEAEVDE